jgi:hypothetical protein
MDALYHVIQSYLTGDSRKNELYIALHIPFFQSQVRPCPCPCRGLLSPRVPFAQPQSSIHEFGGLCDLVPVTWSLWLLCAFPWHFPQVGGRLKVESMYTELVRDNNRV